MSVPGPVTSEPKEVFTFFGLAAYQGQVLEQELMIFALMFQLSKRTTPTRMDVESLLQRLEAHTFGRLLRLARTLTDVPQDLDARLAEALNRRNDLTHRFFSRHAENFLSDHGRAAMITELRRTAALFSEVDIAMTDLREPLSRSLGITPELAHAEADAMLATEPVKPGETSAHKVQTPGTSFVGRLIQTCVGTCSGRGGPLTNRSGWAA